MIGGLLLFVVYEGLSTFWPGPVVEVRTLDGRTLMGELTRSETYAIEPETLEGYPEVVRASVQAEQARAHAASRRRLFRTGNFELTSEHFTWVSDFEIAEGGESHPEWALVLERLSWGRFYGVPTAFVLDGETVATEPGEVWALYNRHHPDVRARWRERRRIEEHEIGRVNHALERERLELRGIEMEHGLLSDAWASAGCGTRSKGSTWKTRSTRSY
jgi:phosphate transport system permease protein